MSLLVDTHLLLWSSLEPERLTHQVATLLESREQQLYFSTVSIWEIAIKHGRGHPEFRMHPGMFRLGLLRAGYAELLITSEHAIAVANLPPIHRDPFDRLLAAQVQIEGLPLITSDTTLARYPGVRLV